MHKFYSRLSTDIGEVVVEASESAILSVAFKQVDDLGNNNQENEISHEGVEQLTAYFEGKRRSFDLPLSPEGTEFQKKVWKQLCNVPYGKTASYLDIANSLGKPTASRAVGMANGKNPIAIIIPCHRIIGSNGKLTGYAGGLDRKSYLLNLESH